VYFISPGDEAHRFVIGSHRKLRKKDIRRRACRRSPASARHAERALLHHFGTLKEIETASIADLCRFRGSAPKAAQDFGFSTPNG